MNVSIFASHFVHSRRSCRLVILVMGTSLAKKDTFVLKPCHVRLITTHERFYIPFVPLDRTEFVFVFSSHGRPRRTCEYFLHLVSFI